jgi:sRNA-binding regulator protein Hfq
VPSEVFAEDIETLLERLEGVTSARVIANDAGDIDTIHVTASADRNESVVRRAVVSALMSQYSLVVDGWRIRVARLREPTRASMWRRRRVEEVLSGSAAQATVELESDQENGGTLIGHARSLPDRVNRQRGVVLATLDALKPVLDEEKRRAGLESIASVQLVGHTAVVVAVSMASASEAQLCVGTAVVEENEAEAVIAATLDAVRKRGAGSQGRGWTMKDRREDLESMRAHYRRLREPQRQLPALTPEANGGEERTDEVADLSQIRPERPGGAAVASEQPARSDAGSRTDQGVARAGPRGSMEDEYLRQLVMSGTPVHIRCRDGYEIPEATVKDFGTYTLLVESDMGRELIFKHGIISIRPLRAGNQLKA